MTPGAGRGEVALLGVGICCGPCNDAAASPSEPLGALPGSAGICCAEKPSDCNLEACNAIVYIEVCSDEQMHMGQIGVHQAGFLSLRHERCI